MNVHYFLIYFNVYVFELWKITCYLEICILLEKVPNKSIYLNQLKLQLLFCFALIYVTFLLTNKYIHLDLFCFSSFSGCPEEGDFSLNFTVLTHIHAYILYLYTSLFNLCLLHIINTPLDCEMKQNSTFPAMELIYLYYSILTVCQNNKALYTNHS